MCSTTIVVRHERIDRPEVYGGRHVDRVEGTEHRFGQRSGGVLSGSCFFVILDGEVSVRVEWA